MNGDRDRALAQLLAALEARGYRFATPTPATHARVVARPDKAVARDLRDVFGWSLPFAREVVGPDIAELMRAADVVEQRGDLSASRVRVSTVAGDYFLHSAYPTTQQDAVFFGPDSYRFADFLRAELPRFAPREHVADIGAGTGVGAITAARLLPNACFTLTDINRAAIRLAAVNWAHANLGPVFFSNCDLLSGIDDAKRPIDAIIANPPYIADPAHRAYRDGGAMRGGEASLTWARAAAERLRPGGVFLLYTGSAIVDGEDRLEAALREALSGFDVSYRELDPDVFGEELERADYADVERIAVVGVVAMKR